MVDPYFAETELAALYDAFNGRKRRDDYDFYLPRAMKAKSVLDVGCGTGSFLKELRERGHQGRLVGVDPGEGMISLARVRTDIEWVLGDMSAAEWKDAFDFVVMTGHAFQAMVRDEDIRLCLAAVSRALTGDGKFAFETRNPAARTWESWDSAYRDEITDPAGRRVRMGTRIDESFNGETITFTHTFTSPAWPSPKTSTSTLRFLGRRDWKSA